MHKKDPFSQFRGFINLMENRVHVLAESHGVEDLAGPQGFAMMYLRDNPDKETYIKNIEERLGVPKSVTSNLIKRTEENGFIQVVSSEEDERYRQIVLAELEESEAQDIQGFHDEMYRQVLAGVDHEDFRISFCVFDHILKNSENKE